MSSSSSGAEYAPSTHNVDEFADGTDQESARSTDSEMMEGEASSATATASVQVVAITNPHVCEATRSRLLHRKRPCVSSSSSSALEGDGMSTTTSSSSSSTKGTVVTTGSTESGGARSDAAASDDGDRGVGASRTSSTFTSSGHAALTTVETGDEPPPADDDDVRLARMMEACKTILLCMGEDPGRDGLVKTPERWAKALLDMTCGYHMTPQQVTNGAIFEENHDEMVVVRNLNIHSLCEHHMLPFTGVVHVGYIPNGKIVGLSKLARIAELYARRLQVQERLTRQIADAVVEMVEPLGVAVVIECTHFCMVMRGVQQSSAITTTSSVRGCFESNSKTRAEFFSILHNGRIKMC